MRITVELSLYPLSDNYRDLIINFVERLKKYPEIELVVNSTSTLIVGEHGVVFDLLKKETASVFASGHNVFVMKVLGFERDIKKKY